MKNKVSMAIFLVALLSMVGCATRPISTTSARVVPSNRLLTKEFLTPKEGLGKVVVKRDSGVGGSVCTTRIFVNSKPIADISVSEKVVFYLPEGEYILSAWPNGICGGGLAEVKVLIEQGKEKVFRVGYGTGSDFFIHPTAF
jgi:hypothetical protein